MLDQLATKADLEKTKQEIIASIKENHQGSSKPEKIWLRGKEVCKILSISQGTLSNLRVSGVLKPSKFGKMYFYSVEEINQKLNSGK